MTLFEQIQENAAMAGINLSAEEIGTLMQNNSCSEEAVDAVRLTFEYLGRKKHDATVELYLKTSRLPKKNPRTFDNFDFNYLHGSDVAKLQGLKTLAPLYAHRNLVFIGPPGIGKTHLAQAFGTECCYQGMKAYFLTFSEMNQKLLEARRADKVGTIINGMVKHACLIIDEVGQCVMDKENTRLFFDIVNRRYNKEGPNTIILTSNVQPEQWVQFFTDDDALLLSLDRAFDNATICTMKGKSYRGRNREMLAVEAGTTSATKV